MLLISHDLTKKPCDSESLINRKVKCSDFLSEKKEFSGTIFSEGLIDDYAKMADQGRSDLDVVFTMILCGTKFLFSKI